ncbi:hypothetical protein SK854_02660 [Lentzea sp. BCCO 10_0061]|uniref:Right handed beta helix domain-containing protein n=1 Tax=Lentzea sokolovensis TaxID=3095429 RepID=A0ABU4UNK0_9PSEU|nr:hypothetical protein [Lentzea sp. BCCO 10_0061]MDX8140994.1 hypothetical protein [Lentzea sp. BCCO 10_0061]
MRLRLAVLLTGGVIVLAACSPTKAAQPTPVAESSSATSTSTTSSSSAAPSSSSAAPSSTTRSATNGPVKPPANSPAPAGSPGWKLTQANTGLAAHGLNCDSLPLYTGPGAPAAGTVISGKRIEQALTLFAGNITVEKSCIRPKNLGETAPLITTNGPCGSNSCQVTGAPVTIRDSNIDGSALSAKTIAGSCAFLGVGTLQRNYISGMGSGICFYNTGSSLSGLAEGNYVRGLRSDGESHNDGATVRDFPLDKNAGRTLTFRNNRIDCSTGNDTGALFIQTYGGDIDNVTVEGNLLEGGGYQLGLESGFDNLYGRNMKSINNRFSGTGWGAAYVSQKGASYKWAVWQDNFLHDANAPDAKGKPAGTP